MKSKRTVGLPQNWHPVAFPFKDGGGLAEHPLICHHQRVFGSRENGKENERKWRKEEAAAKLPPTIYCQREVINRFVQTKTYICSESREITKATKIIRYYKG